MTYLMKTAALSLAIVGGGSAAFADAHVDVLNTTCAEFAAMDISEQESFLTSVTAALESAENDEIKIGDVQVLCNGFEDEAVSELLDDEA